MYLSDGCFSNRDITEFGSSDCYFCVYLSVVPAGQKAPVVPMFLYAGKKVVTSLRSVSVSLAEAVIQASSGPFQELNHACFAWAEFQMSGNASFV